jgi:hypothetical protein
MERHGANDVAKRRFRWKAGDMAKLEQILVCRRRWLEAVSSGAPGEALVEDTLGGCREAVLCLGRRLTDLGYPVRSILRPIPADLDARVARLEGLTGVPVPRVLHQFWRMVGGISFVDLKQYKHVAFWDGLAIRGAHQFCDGVHVDACDADWLSFIAEEVESRTGELDEPPLVYSLAPDGYHKDDISGGLPYAIGSGSDWAPTWENFTWSGYRRPDSAVSDPTDFVSYLRTAILECAGFPGLFGHPKFEGIRQDLVHDLPVF